MFRGIQHLLESEINIFPAQLFFPCSILHQNKSYFIFSAATVISVKHSVALRTYSILGTSVQQTWKSCHASEMVVSLLFGFISTLYPGGRAHASYSYLRDLDLITQQDLYPLYNCAHKSPVFHNKQQYKFQTCYGEHVGALHSFVSLFKGGTNKTHKAAT